jgi:hypothetical protein
MTRVPLRDLFRRKLLPGDADNLRARDRELLDNLRVEAIPLDFVPSRVGASLPLLANATGAELKPETLSKRETLAGIEDLAAEDGGNPFVRSEAIFSGPKTGLATVARRGH